MFSTVAKTAFLTAALADYNPWHAPMFDLNAKLETVYPEIEKAIGDDTTCYDLVHYHGIGTALKLNYLCMGVADYKFQCAGKDAQPFGKSKKKVEDEETTDETDEAKSDAADSGSEEKKVADGERRLQDDGKEEEEGEKEEGEEDDLTEDKSEGGFSEEEIKNRAVWEEEQKELEKETEENVKKFGELLTCVTKHRYYGWLAGSWLNESDKKKTCPELITEYGEGSCKSVKSKEYGLNVCCPGYCQTAKELGCAEHNVSDEVKDAIDQNQIGSKKFGEECEEHKECAEALQCGSEARPTTPAPETTTTTTTVAPEKDSEETTTTTEEATAEEATAEEATAEEVTAEEATAEEATETATDGEGRLLQEEENKDEEKADTEEENKDEEKADTEEENAETEKDNKDAEQEETTNEEKPTKKTCQRSGASHFGFGFIAALLAVVTL